MQVLGDEDKATISGDITQPGLKLNLVGENPSEWVVRPERFSVSSPQPTVDCGRIVGGVLEKLPWTPINAVGVNSKFEAESHDVLEELGIELPTSRLECAQRTAHIGVKREGRLINVQVSAVDDEETKAVSIVINSHFDFSANRKQLNQMDLNHKIVQICNEFSVHRQEAIDVAQEVLGVSLNE